MISDMNSLRLRGWLSQRHAWAATKRQHLLCYRILGSSEVIGNHNTDYRIKRLYIYIYSNYGFHADYNFLRITGLRIILENS